jgi:ABC-type multidrug transport system permease subunit
VTDHPLWQLILMRWRVFAREPGTLFWAYGFPLLLAVVLGYAFRNQKPEPVVAAVESGADAERVAGALRSRGMIASVLPADEARRQLWAGKVAIVIAPESPRVYRFDETRPDSRIARALVDDALQRADGRVDPTQTHDVLTSEPGTRYIDFLIPGLIGFGLMSSGLWGVGFVLVEMRTRKLIKRMVATPMKRWHFLASFVLVRATFLLAELPILIGFAHSAFKVPINGSIALLIALALLGSLVFAGLGLLVATRTENVQTAGGLINLISMPMALGSGVFFSSQRFGTLFQPLLKALPLTALNDSMRSVMIDGAGFAQVARPCLVLAAWGVLAFAVALRIFRWR